MRKPLLSFLLLTSFAKATGSGITYNGRLLDPQGNAVVSNNVQFKLQVRTPGNENCLMYEEIQSKDMSNSDGVFSITINDGTGSRTDSTGFALDQIFANRGSFNFPGGYCVTGNSYNTTPTDGRKLQVYFNDGSFATGQWEPTPSMAINFIPMAIEAQQVGGYKKEQILKLADGVSTTGSELDATKWTSLQALINGTSTAYTKPTDQVTQLYGATIPTPSNGQSIRWNSSLNAGAGGWENFTAGSASAVTSVSSANADIVVANGSTTPQLTLNSGTGANQIVKLNGLSQLPAVDGSSVTNVSASKIVGTAISIASLSNGQVLKYNGTNWVNATLTDSDTLGGLSCANGRVAYYTGGSWSCLEVTSGNTINTIVSRDGSGGANFGTVNTGTLKLNDGVSGEISLTTPATVASYAMRLPTSVGAAGQVLTTDGNSPAQLSWATASSQWTTSGSNIYYNSGNVGIGTSSPATSLHIIETGTTLRGIISENVQSTASVGAMFIGRHARGTPGAPMAVQANDYLAAFQGMGYDGSSYPTPATSPGFKFMASENWAPNANGQEISFWTTPNGNLNASERMRITNAGNIGIGVAAPATLLEVSGPGTTAGGLADIKITSAGAYGAGITLAAGGAGGRTYSLNSTGPSSSSGAGKVGLFDVNAVAYRMIIDSSGNVGIGTTFPSYLTEISGTPSASGFLLGLVDSRAFGIDKGGGITFNGKYNSAGNAANFAGIKGLKANATDGDYAGNMTFETRPAGAGLTERMRITSTGAIGIGLTNPSYKLDVNGDTNIASGSALRFGGTSVCTSAGCTSSSDRNLKENIQPLQGSLEKVLILLGVEYDYKDKEQFTDKHQVGIIAQEVEKVYPEVVYTDPKTGLKSVAYDHLVAPLIEAVKTLYSHIQKLEFENSVKDQKIKELEQRIERIEKSLNSR